MSTIIPVDLPDHRYDIHLEPGLLSNAGAIIAATPERQPRPRKLVAVLVIADETVAAAHGKTLITSLNAHDVPHQVVTFAPGEQSKSIETCEKLWQACAESGIDRAGAVIALGGGVSGDMAGLLARRGCAALILFKFRRLYSLWLIRQLAVKLESIPKLGKTLSVL